MSTRTIVATLFILAILCLVLGGVYHGAAYAFVATSISLFFSATLLTAREVSHRMSRLNQSIKSVRRRIVSDMAVEFNAMQNLRERFPECRVMTTGYTMRFANLEAIIDILDERRPKLVVELGSGLSTICVSSWMKQNGGGRLISIDHDEFWSGRTLQVLRSHQLDPYVEMRVAPLSLMDCEGERVPWYGVDDSDLQHIDLLLVDGPPSDKHERGLTRLPAFYKLSSRLSPNGRVMLDDYHRPGEIEIVRHWCSKLKGWNVRRVGNVMALLERISTAKVSSLTGTDD